MQLLMCVLGIVVVIGLCWLLSWNRKAINWKLVGRAMVAQFILTVLIVKVPVGQYIIEVLSNVVSTVINCGYDGVTFVFGDLADRSRMFVFAVQVLGNIIFVAAFAEMLSYFGIIGFVVKNLGICVKKVVGTSEVESFVATANMFLGQTESPIVISKYIGRMTRSEIFVILVSGMGSMSVSILTGYVSMGVSMESLLIASVLVPIGTMVISKIILPEMETPENIDNITAGGKSKAANVVDAIMAGAGAGLTMVLNIAAALIAIIGIVAFVNMLLGFVDLSIETIFGYIFSPFGYLMGFDAINATREGVLLGQKLALNEFVAYSNLGSFINTLPHREALMMTISLAGFANVGSMAICVGGIGALCPEKRPILSSLVVRAMLGGMLLSIMSAMLCGIVLSF